MQGHFSTIKAEQVAAGLCLALATAGCGIVMDDSSSQAPAIHARLEQAAGAQVSSQAALTPVERDLVFLADFENDDMVCLAGGKTLAVPFDRSHYREGKFGRGFHFEKPRHNLLTPEMADVEANDGGFRPHGGAELSVVSTDTPFGKRALEVVMRSRGAGVETRPVPVNHVMRSWHEYAWTLLASVYVKGPKGGKIRLDVSFLPKDVKIVPKELGGGKKEPEPTADQSTPQEVELTGEWQRVACHAKADCRAGGREAVFGVQSASDQAAALFMDGLQFEQAEYYPQHHLMPTTWLPGGESAPATSACIDGLFRDAFPVDQGTIAFWTLTPHESNLINQGNVFWLSFANGWQPGWNMGNYMCSVGGEGAFYSAGTVKNVVDDGKWHHLAMSWDGSKGFLYVDGAQVAAFDRNRQGAAKNLELFSFVLGGFAAEPQAANSVMDEVGIFKRKLADDEIRRLAEGAAPLRITDAPIQLSRCERSVFYRDESEATLEFTGTPLAAGIGQVTVDLSVGGLLLLSERARLDEDSTKVRFTFDARRLKCGTYQCQIGSMVEGKGFHIEFPIDIVPALRPDHYLMSTWGGGGETAEWRSFLKTLGVNCVDTGGTNLDELGKNGFQYGWHYNFGNGLWSPANREKVRLGTRKEAKARAGFPNWKYTLLNSEVGVGLPDAENRKAWFDAWAERELGFEIPPQEKGWAFGTSNNPVMCWFPEGKKPGKDGVYDSSREMGFLSWWYNHGCGWWRLNAEAATEIKKLRPDVKCWTDPLNYPGQIAELAAGGTWSYQLRPEPLIGEFEASYAAARGSGKEFYTTLGMNYVNGLTDAVACPDGAKRNLAPTADDMIQQAWLAVSRIPSSGLTYWDLTGVFHGLRKENGRYAEPGCDEKLGTVLKNDLLPLGAMLKGVPNAQRQIALLLPESTLWMDSGEGGWSWGTAHYGNQWKSWIGQTGQPYDVVLDSNITPGALSKYRLIVFPMAQFVEKRVHDELTAAGKSGTRIVVDGHCRQEYPNMEKLAQTYQLPVSRWAERSYYEDTVRRLGGIVKELAPALDAVAVGEQGGVLTSVRGKDGVKYVIVVNDNRQAGQYTEWTKDSDFMPYGKAQKATVSLLAPADSAVYEFTESKALPTKSESGRLTVTVDLPPHAGRVLCVYPESLDKLSVDVGKVQALGSRNVIKVKMFDKKGGRPHGIQLARISVVDPDGVEHDESGIYRMTAGAVDIPLRLAVNDKPGAWTIKAVEKTTGLSAEARFDVTDPAK